MDVISGDISELIEKISQAIFRHWIDMPNAPPFELPFSVYTNPDEMLAYLIDRHGDRAIEVLWREYQLAELTGDYHLKTHCFLYFGGLERNGLSFLDLPDHHVVTPKETAEILVANFGVSVAEAWARDKINTYRSIHDEQVAMGLNRKPLDPHWYDVLGLILADDTRASVLNVMY